MRKLIFAIFLFAVGYVFAGESENPGNANKRGDIVGTVIDSADGRPIEYATVALYKSNKELLTGGISDSEGFFRLKDNPVGDYYLTVTFLGYKTITIPDVKILNNTREVSLGDIRLEPNVKELEGVDVVADQASVSYKIDKKVVNVGQQLTAKSGTAVDILENIPSVKVDIEGNVSLRGSDSFTVLIDGRPTVLNPSDALSQIPAGAIDNIEIITNPSAKYEPDGAAGIINIITKKNKLNGMSGIVNVNAGMFENYGGDFTLDNRSDKVHLYLGGDYSHRKRPGTINYERDVFYDSGNHYHVRSNGDFFRGGESYGVKGGADFKLSDNDNIGIGLRTGYWGMSRGTEKEYTEYFQFDSMHNYYTTDDVTDRGGIYYESNLNYKHGFNKDKTHYIEALVNYSGRDMDEETRNLRNNLDGTIASAQNSTEVGPSEGVRLKLDYMQPFSNGNKLEAGWQSHFDNSMDDNKVYHYDTITEVYEFQDTLSKNTEYTRKTHAVYSTFGGEYGSFGYQVGLRMEYTYRYLELVGTNENYKIDRPDYFPTLHLSYQMPAEQQTMVSYTRRIKRPRGWYLEPFITYMDAYNVRKGNPDLQPEYINSFDLSYQKKFQKKNFVSLEGYYRITENNIERVMSKYEDNSKKFLHTYVNAGTAYALGVEGMLNYSPFKWYTMNLMADFYDYRLKGTLNDVEFDQHDFSWNTRFNNTIKLGPNTRFQFDVMYQSPTIRAQGTSEEFFTVSAALKQDMLKRKLSATLQVRDVLGTMDHTFVSQQEGAFYQYTHFDPNTPYVTLTLSYKLNNYKVKRERGNGEGGMDDGGDMM